MATTFSDRHRAVSIIALLGLAASVNAHSWIEYGYKIAQNGTMIGEIGFPRGFLPRNSTDPLWSDPIPQCILPYKGQSAYSGDEIINKYPFQADPEYPMLEAAPGDYVALMHYENGHVSLPQNQPHKPLNRGTIYLYGTSKPAVEEKLFDVHLQWNQAGTGGDKRGILLATRNYDDGQCYQPNDGPIADGRATELAGDGASAERELVCQSDIKLPENLEPGSVYTVYWYWDWPDLDATKMDVNATSDGLFPWAGSFMRGDPNPNHWTMDMITKNESYSSAIDIKITAKADGASVKEMSFIDKQDVYSQGIQAQMESNYQVDVGGSGDSKPAPSTSTSTAPIPTTTSQTGNPVVEVPEVTTVFVYSTVPPTTIFKTVYETAPAPGEGDHTTQTTEASASVHTSTVVVTKTVHVPAGGGGQTIAPTPSGYAHKHKRSKWSFGSY